MSESRSKNSAYANRIDVTWGSISVSIIGLDDLIAIERASNRAQDRLDLELLEMVRAR